MIFVNGNEIPHLCRVRHEFLSKICTRHKLYHLVAIKLTILVNMVMGCNEWEVKCVLVSLRRQVG